MLVQDANLSSWGKSDIFNKRGCIDFSVGGPFQQYCETASIALAAHNPLEPLHLSGPALH